MGFWKKDTRESALLEPSQKKMNEPEELNPEERGWIKESALKMDEKELARNIILFLQHSNSSYNKEATIAGYKLYLWAESKET